MIWLVIDNSKLELWSNKGTFHIWLLGPERKAVGSKIFLQITTWAVSQARQSAQREQGRASRNVMTS